MPKILTKINPIGAQNKCMGMLVGMGLKKENIKIYCEHCEKAVENLWICKMDSIISTRYALFLTSCQKSIEIYSSIEFIEPMFISNTFFDELQIQLN